MTEVLPHISVCICTFKRPQLLEALLRALAAQVTEGRFTFSTVVADNDAAESARSTVERLAASVAYPLRYEVEHRQNIALARNRALASANGDFIAFIDDDECPGPDWLCVLLRTCESLAVSGVLSPVRPYFETKPPLWMLRTGFFDRPEYPTGTRLSWPETRTGNALVRHTAIADIETPFRPMYGAGGEDQDFFRRLMERGHRFVWCNEAPVYEFVPRTRASMGYMCRRALLRGQNERNALTFRSVAKSAVATLAYAICLPFLSLFGRHLFARYLVKWCDHAGKLCGFAGFRPMGEKYLAG